MKMSEMKAVLSVALAEGFPIMIQSAPGAGKSDGITQVVSSLKMDLLITHPVTSDPTDFKGLPAVTKGGAEFLPYGDLQEMMNATAPLVVFFDDLGQASNSVQAACMQLFLAREINGKRISDHVRFVAATNRRTDNAGVAGIISPLINRLTVLDLDVDVGDWIQWGIQNKMPLELISFIKFRPALLSNFDPKKRDQPFASPRSVAQLGKWMNAGIISLPVWSGCVGEAFATEFFGFHGIFKKVAPLIPQIAINPQSVPVPAEVDLQFALSSALAFSASPKVLANYAAFMSRMSNEFAVFFWKQATGKSPDLCKSHAFLDWSVKNPDALQ